MKAEFQPYPAYHHVESAWLGEMPVGWKAIQLARMNNKLTNGYVGPTRDILREEGVRYLQSLHIHEGEIIFNTPYFVSEEWSEAHRKSVLNAGDVLIVQTGADTGQLAAVTNEYAGCNCHALIIISTKRHMIDGFYLSSVLRSHYGYHSLYSVRTGALHPHLNCTKVRDIYVPVPPLEDQQAILAFLDRETTKIDQLIKVRRKQVERLQEQRTAVIYYAVTQGVDSHAKMKPSGIEWLGDVPESWDVGDLKHYARFSVGCTPPTGQDHLYGGEFPWCTIGDLSGEEIYETEKTISAAGVTGSRMESTPKGSLLFSFKLSIGQVAFAGVDLFTNEAIASFRVQRGFVPRFMFYAFPVYIVENAGTNIYGAKLLNQYLIKNAPIVRPSLNEQEEIVAHIVHETAKLDNLAAKYHRELELLAEYRASLISHAVAGKIDVRGLVASSPLEEVTQL